MSQPRRFRINAKNIFLTYPRCPIPKEEALNQILSTQTPSNKKFVRVCRELHDDGTPHLHVLVQFEGKVQITNKRLFDLTSANRSSRQHPNIQAARSASDVKNYIEKGGDYLDWGQFQVDGRIARGGQQAVNYVYASAINTTNKNAALEIIKEKAPKDFILQYHNINANLDKIFQKPPAPYQNPFSQQTYTVPNELQQWAQDNVMDSAARPIRPKSIIIEGPSRIGKTLWARSLGPHNYLCGHVDLNQKVFSNNSWYNVIDDVSPKYLKHWREFIGAQKDWQSNTKYGKPILVQGGIPSIILCNPGPDTSYISYL